METLIKSVLIIGCQRSGTTLLASLLGRHSEVNMLFESTNDDVFKLIGKKYQGNKLLAHRQIRWGQRASKFGHLVNRIWNFDLFSKRRHHYVRPFPTSRLSIKDYLDKGTTIIIITRKKEKTVSSIVSRSSASRKLASKEYDKAMNILDKLMQKNVYHIEFETLVNDPKTVLNHLCEYLELSFEERMLDGSKYNFVYPSSKIDQSKAGRNPTTKY